MPTTTKAREKGKRKAPRRAIPLVPNEDEIIANLTPLKRSLLRRDIRFLAQILSPIPDERLEAAASQPDSYVSITAQLSQPEAQACLDESSDPWEEFMAEGLGEYKAMLTERGKCLSVTDVSKHLDLCRQAVDLRRQRGDLLGLETGRRGYAYPPWQFAKRGVVTGLKETIHALSEAGADEWEMLSFFLSPNSDTNDKPPIDLLASGGADGQELVIRAAELHGSQGPG